LAASPVAAEIPLNTFIFLGFVSELAAARQTDLATLASTCRTEWVFPQAMFLFKTAA
jgi:16S rRNA C1402 (ribose-2'-O) methylase RsmI